MLSAEEQDIRERWKDIGPGGWEVVDRGRADIETLLAALEAERAKVTQLEMRLGELVERLGHAEAEEAKVAQLREALRRHGTHTLSCPSFEEEFAAAFRGERGNDQSCTCGLSAVLFE